MNNDNESPCMNSRGCGGGRVLRTCPIALSGLASVGFLIIFLSLSVSRHVEQIKSAISETALASVTLYHVSSSIHALEGTSDGLSLPSMKQLMAANRELRASMKRLFQVMQPEEMAPEGAWNAPIAFLFGLTGFSRSTDEMREIWQSEVGGQSIATALERQFKTCSELCAKPNMTHEDRALYLRRLGDLSLGVLLPRLKQLRAATADWERRIIQSSIYVVFAAFVCIVASILFTRFGVVGPLLKDLDAANADLSSENEKLEHKVAIRTNDLKLALDRTEAAYEARTRFLGSVNHEMRTPLNGVLGVAALLNATRLDRRQTEYVDTIVKSGQILVRLIDDVLDYVSLSAGKMHLILQPVTVRDVVAESLERLHPAAVAKGLWLKFRSEGDDGVIVDADPDRLQQIVNNVVGNAIKFTSQGGVQVMLEQARKGDSMHVSMRIEDSGTGIAQHKLERMFEPFDRAALGVPTAGAGLGLAVAKSLTEEMSGDISVESEEGQGSLFTVRLIFPISQIVSPEKPQALSA